MDMKINESIKKIGETKLELKKSNEDEKKNINIVSNSNKEEKKKLKKVLSVNSKKKKRKKNRCFFPECNKKLTSVELLTNKCKCNNYFCKKHLLNTKHNCNYDYQKDKMESIKLKNPKIEFDKLNTF